MDNPFPTIIEFEQNDPEGYGGPRHVKINGQPVMVRGLIIEYTDDEWVNVTIKIKGARINKGQS